MKMKRTPPLVAGERMVLQSQGGCKTSFRSGWMLGQLYLTDRRLLFSRPSGVALEVPLGEITAIAVERRRFVLGRPHVLGLTYQAPRAGRALKAWIVMGNMEAWAKKIREMTLPAIDEEAIHRVAEAIDPESRNILWYIWQNRHATIDELADLIGAPNHMDVLLKIRDRINPVAEGITGFSILAFEPSRFDVVTGGRILSSWWISGADLVPGGRKGEPLLDIFDEANHVIVIAELPGVQEEDIVLKVEKNRLTISVSNSAGGPAEEILLPAEVDPEPWTKRYNNSVLEVRLAKRRSEQDKGEHNAALVSGSA